MVAPDVQRVDGLHQVGSTLAMTGRFQEDAVIAGTTLQHLGGDDVFVAKADLTSDTLLWGQRFAGTDDEFVPA